MVEQPLKPSVSPKALEEKAPLFKWTPVSIQEIFEKGYRLEASVYGIEGRHARITLEQCKWDLVLLGEVFIENAFYGSRSKRVYVNRTNKEAIGFLGSSEMLSVHPKPVKFILKKDGIDGFSVEKGQVLLSRSGTIGNVTYVSSTLEKYFISEHAIRISCKQYSGYVYAFLRSKIGRTLVESNTYGAVINQVEPEHLEALPVPNPPPILKQQIHDLIEKSFRLRDESNEMIDGAQALLIEALELPDLKKMKAKSKQFGGGVEFLNFVVPLHKLEGRLDASYHIPIVNEIEACLHKKAREVVSVGDKRISQSVILPGRFKRVYVEEGSGVVFFGGKQLYELDPSNKKYLSLDQHGDRISDELKIHENTILISRSGTIGKVAIAPSHWDNWIPNEHVIRIIPASDDVAGYVYAWLSSEYAYTLVTRFTHGAVVDEIDDKQVSEVSVPLLKNLDLQKEINNQVLEANRKRAEAYALEQEAISILNEKVIYAR